MRGCSRPTSSARVSLAPAPGSGQLSHTHFIFRMPRALVILSSPWWTPGLPHARSALCPRTEAPSCHPPAAQLLLKDVLQRAGILCFHPRLKNTWLQTQIEGKEGAKASCNQAPTIFGGGRFGEGNWQPTPVFLPGESQGQEAWWAAFYGVAELDTTE